MADIVPPYKDEELQGEGISKKDLISYLQENASETFLTERKLKGAVKNVVKTKTKDQLVDDYKHLFESKEFKGNEKASEAIKKEDTTEITTEVKQVTEKTKKLQVKSEEPVKYTKKILKNGDKCTFPKKGDEVECFYTGKLDNGKVFDTNMEENYVMNFLIEDKKGKKPPLKFRVGVGKVIRGWDEALQTMSKGEKAEIVIQPEWAYGKKGVEGKIPPGATLTFEVELISVC